jgi:endonuclease-3
MDGIRSINIYQFLSLAMNGAEGRAKEALRRLKVRYKRSMRTELMHSNPWELLVATILSAQAQDRQVNKATESLFRRYRSVEDYAASRPSDLYPYVKSIGLYKQKAKSIVNAAKQLQKDFGSRVPSRMEDLVALPGVGRKTANVVLSNAFDVNVGIAIDTHCITVSNRLGFARTRNPERIEARLMKLFPKREWGNINHLFIALGRDVCTARAKYCAGCVLNDICPSSNVR